MTLYLQSISYSEKFVHFKYSTQRVKGKQLDAQLIISIFRQPLHVSGVSRPIIRRYNSMYITVGWIGISNPTSTTDSHLKRIIPNPTNTTDSHLKRIIPNPTSTTDSHLKRIIPNPTSTTDSHLKRIIPNPTSTTDSHLKRIIPNPTSTTDSHLKRIIPNPTNTTDSHLKRITNTNCCIHTVVVPPDDGPR